MNKAMLIDQTKCIGCGACTVECKAKYDASYGILRTQDPEDSNNMEKCSFCAHRVLEGESTYCAEACPVGAIAFGEREGLISQGEGRVNILKQAGKDKAALYGKEDTGVLLLKTTVPFFIYLFLLRQRLFRLPGVSFPGLFCCGPGRQNRSQRGMGPDTPRLAACF